jgi:8-oxo-dGTP pyrophosphatase MutT (NUDIX family)
MSSEPKPKPGSQRKPRPKPAGRPKPGPAPTSKPTPARKPKPRRRPRAPAREISAGGVVVRGEDVVVIVPTRRASDGTRVLGLPKGHVDPGETAVQAAQREVREETGISAEAVRELGEARYWYRRNGRTIGKSVSFYLFSYLGGDTADHDDEVEEVRWIGLKQAQTALTHEAEREMVGLALDYLGEGASKDR